MAMARRRYCSSERGAPLASMSTLEPSLRPCPGQRSQRWQDNSTWPCTLRQTCSLAKSCVPDALSPRSRGALFRKPCHHRSRADACTGARTVCSGSRVWIYSFQHTSNQDAEEARNASRNNATYE
jgi:hypothetical protein